MNFDLTLMSWAVNSLISRRITQGISTELARQRFWSRLRAAKAEIFFLEENDIGRFIHVSSKCEFETDKDFKFALSRIHIRRMNPRKTMPSTLWRGHQSITMAAIAFFVARKRKLKNSNILLFLQRKIS